MPAYDYDCARCGPFTALRPMAQWREPHACPGCDTPAPRAALSVPNLATMDAGRRRATATNERSSHAPKLSSQLAPASGAHAAGCGCCTPKGGRARTGADGSKAFPAARPWMISH